ncbi:MAG: hypothetical protein AB1324_00375 [Candidatus Micrarchaeota archaeon]
MLQRAALALVLLLSLSAAIDLESPERNGVREGDTVDLGTIGPGQTVELLIDRRVTEGGIYGEGGFYDQVRVQGLPAGWTAEDSKLYQDPLRVTITADPDSPEGEYTALVTVMDEGDGEELGNVTFKVKMRITWDVLDFDVSPAYLDVGPGQPARFAITIRNKASTSDVFTVSSIGAKRWEFIKPVFVPAHSSKTIYYEIVGGEEEAYKATIRVQSQASENIADERNVTLFIHSGLLGDYRATNNGVAVFPVFEGIIYSLAGLLSNVFK